MYVDDDPNERPRHRRLNKYIVVGPEWINFAITLTLGAAPVTVFFVMIAPDVYDDLGLGPVIVAAILSAIMYTSLILTGLTDPGIIAREPPLPSENQLPRNKEYNINGFVVTTKRCITCHIYRPPRCSHCAVCNNCVEKFDHHCPWVGTCIGRRNYQPYLAFIFSAFLTCLLVIALCIWRLVPQGDDDFGDTIGSEPAAAILIIYCFLALLFVGALSALHTYLLSTNQTTYEYFRHRYPRAKNPFRRTLLKNIFEAFCGATGLYRYCGPDHPAQIAPSSATAATNAALPPHEHPQRSLQLTSIDSIPHPATYNGDAVQSRDRDVALYAPDGHPVHGYNGGNGLTSSGHQHLDLGPPYGAGARSGRGGGALGDAPDGGEVSELELGTSTSSGPYMENPLTLHVRGERDAVRGGGCSGSTGPMDGRQENGETNVTEKEDEQHEHNEHMQFNVPRHGLPMMQLPVVDTEEHHPAVDDSVVVAMHTQ